MDKILIIAATSDLAKSYIEFIKNDNSEIDVIVRDSSKLSKKSLSWINKIYEFDLNNLDNLNNFSSTSKYSQIIFFQGIDIIKPFNFYEIKDITQTFNVNVLSTILLLNILISKKYILKGASIVLISSISGITKGSPGHVLYSSSKAALIGLVKSLSLEFSKRKIRINCISPGLIKTASLFEKNSQILSDEAKLVYESLYPLGIGELDSLNGTIDFLLGSSSKWITGQNIVVDGGLSNV
jgi:NAD(P)-dependent dehydrogenase (short-subunit alcohol dehydrogenase family)